MQPWLDGLKTATAEARAALQALLTALDDLSLTRRQRPAAIIEAWNLLDRLEGQLKDRLPGQAKLVATFFMPSDIASARTESSESEDDSAPPSL